MRTPEDFAGAIQSALSDGSSLAQEERVLVAMVRIIQDDAMTTERNEADAEWKPQVERLTREVIMLRGHIDRIYAAADEAKTMATPF